MSRCQELWFGHRAQGLSSTCPCPPSSACRPAEAAGRPGRPRQPTLDLDVPGLSCQTCSALLHRGPPCKARSIGRLGIITVNARRETTAVDGEQDSGLGPKGHRGWKPVFKGQNGSKAGIQKRGPPLQSSMARGQWPNPANWGGSALLGTLGAGLGVPEPPRSLAHGDPGKVREEGSSLIQGVVLPGANCGSA